MSDAPNPFAAPNAPLSIGSGSGTNQVWQRLIDIAKAHRALNLVVLFNIVVVVAGMLLGQPLVISLIFVGWAVGMLLVYRLASKLGESGAIFWPFGVLFCGVFGLGIMLVLVQKAAKTLKEGGIEVGFLGAVLEPSPPAGWIPSDTLMRRFAAGSPLGAAAMQRGRGVVHCPCCGYRTLPSQAKNDVCPVCAWTDDGQGDADADVVRNGFNGAISLTDARKTYRHLGAVRAADLERVRRPTQDEQD